MKKLFLSILSAQFQWCTIWAYVTYFTNMRISEYAFWCCHTQFWWFGIYVILSWRWFFALFVCRYIVIEPLTCILAILCRQVLCRFILNSWRLVIGRNNVKCKSVLSINHRLLHSFVTLVLETFAFIHRALHVFLTCPWPVTTSLYVCTVTSPWPLTATLWL